jgi:hypothetical protein
LSATYTIPRNYQNFSDALEGLFNLLQGKLVSFQASELQSERGSVCQADHYHNRNHSLLILRACSVRRKWCPGYKAKPNDRSDNQTDISTSSPDAIEELINSEKLHRAQAVDGSALICLNPMLNRARKTSAT